MNYNKITNIVNYIMDSERSAQYKILQDDDGCQNRSSYTMIIKFKFNTSITVIFRTPNNVTYNRALITYLL